MANPFKNNDGQVKEAKKKAPVDPKKARREEMARARMKQQEKLRQEEGNAFKRFFKRIGRWFREMKSELKKVVWPTKKQLFTNAGIAVVCIIISAIVIWAFDELASKIVELLISIGS